MSQLLCLTRMLRAHRLLRPASGGRPVALITAATSAAPSACRTFHSSTHRASLTGISFSPVPPAELKVTQWLKAQEIAARRKHAHGIATRVWAANPNEDWTQLTIERSEALLRADGQDPAQWDCNEFHQHTLATKCPWRHAELARERKAYFEQCLARLLKDLRNESDAYKHGTMMMTKNELTRKLIVAMGGKLPLASEVEDAWQDRHSLPAIDWVEDAI